MRTFLWSMLMFSGLMLFGCDSQEKATPQETPASQQPARSEQAMPAGEVKGATPVAGVVQGAGEKVQEQTGELAKSTENLVDEAGKKAVAAAEAGTQMAQATASEVKEQAAAAAAATTGAVESLAGKKPAITQEIVLEASYGNVTFPHGMHGEAFACSTCHGDQNPAEFEITKDVAHQLCKDCHKDQGAGPTGCTGCHKK